MAFFCQRFLYKYAKCVIAAVVIAFFMQIIIALNLFPSGSDNISNIRNSFTYVRHDTDVSARKFVNGFYDDEDLIVKKKNSKQSGTQLRLQELDFTPICDIKSREAISAIHRAKTQTCKQEIVNKTCLIQESRFYPESLLNSCAGAGTFGKHLGCYQDEKKSRLLSGFYGNYADSNSAVSCLDICLQAGFPYAGVQYGSECFCGENVPPSSAKILDSLCDMICPGEPFQYCGGYFTMNVYETGSAVLNLQTPKISTLENETVRIVFLLTLNGRALRQVYRLINALYRSNHYFYIHVDARQDYLHRKLLELENKFSNIRLAPQRFATIWGGASLLKMLLASMKDFIALGWKWDFVINLSESDFPIKSLEKLEKFLASNKGLNFVKSHGREAQRFIKKQGLDKTFIECDTHMWRVGDRKLPRGITIDGGSDWVALSSKFVAYVVGKKDDLLDGLDIIFQHTLLPAESFFHTVLRNSHFCNTYVDNNLHVTNWKRKLGCKCQYKHVVDWCGCSPNDFRTEDWQRIQSTQDKQLFFARKFEPIINQEIINRVEQLIGFDDLYHLDNVEAYWQSMYDIEDLTASTDDLLVTHGNSIIRHNARILEEEGCFLKLGDILEINSYKYADIYKGNLILHKVYNTNKELAIETWYKPQKKMQSSYEKEYIDIVKIFKVSSDYDQKESTFRNLGDIMGPFSEPILLYEMSPNYDKQLDNLTIIWLDPAENVAYVTDIQINENNLTNFIKPELKLPLLPGIWKVGLFHKLNMLTVTKFLISPLEYFSGKELSNQETKLIHSGTQDSYKKYNFIKPSQFVPDIERSQLLQKVARSNVDRINQDLREWIDNLNFEFYYILGSCVKTNLENMDELQCGKHTFQPCHKVDWSTLSSNPKGSIGLLNIVSGRLERK